MAGKNQVTLTFAGDSQSLDRTFTNVGEGARKAEESLEQVGSGVTHFQDRVSQSGEKTQEYANRLDRLEESGGNAETRMLGLGAGISGTSALMNRGQLDAEGMAMAFADLGDFTEHTLAPAMRNVKDGVGGAIEGFKTGEGVAGAFRRNMLGIGVAALGAAAAIGVVALAFMEHNQRQEEARRQATAYSDALDALGSTQAAMKQHLVESGTEFGGLIRGINSAGMTIDEYTAAVASGSLSTSEFSDMLNLSTVQGAIAVQQHEEYVASVEAGTESQQAEARAIQDSTLALRDYADQLRASFDPLFAMVDAQQGFEDAQREQLLAQQALNDAIDEHGANSTEAAEAATRLRDADTALTRSVIDLEGAATTLSAAVQDGTVSAESARSQFIAMATSMGVPRAEAERLAGRFGLATAKAQELGRQRPKIRTSLEGFLPVLGNLSRVELALARIPDKVKVLVDIAVHASGNAAKVITSGGRAHGGPVAAGRLYEVAEHGKAELLEMGARTYLIPGTDGRVIPADGTAGLGSFMHASGGSGTTVVVNVNVAGSIRSDRDLVELIRDELSYGGLRGARR